jgi:hypothetical protein
VCHASTHHSTAHHSTVQYSTAQHSTVQWLYCTTQFQHSTAQHSTAQHSTAQHGLAQPSATQHNTTQHNTTQHSLPTKLCAAASMFNCIGPVHTPKKTATHTALVTAVEGAQCKPSEDTTDSRCINPMLPACSTCLLTWVGGGGGSPDAAAAAAGPRCGETPASTARGPLVQQPVLQGSSVCSSAQAMCYRRRQALYNAD